MKQKLDTKSLLERAKVKQKRSKVSFTFNTVIYSQFQQYCKKQKVPMARLLEELMKDVINTI